MCWQAIKWALDVPGPETVHARLVLIRLATLADNKNWYCWPSREYLADKAQQSERSVQRHLQALERVGLIAIEQRFDEMGSQTSNGYRLLRTSNGPLDLGDDDDAASDSGNSHSFQGGNVYDFPVSPLGDTGDTASRTIRSECLPGGDMKCQKEGDMLSPNTVTMKQVVDTGTTVRDRGSRIRATVDRSVEDLAGEVPTIGGVDPAEVGGYPVISSVSRRPRKIVSKRRSLDTAYGLAQYFGAMAQQTYPGVLEVSNTGALAKRFSVWHRDGLEYSQIQEMIRHWLSRSQPNLRVPPWRALLADRVALQNWVKRRSVAAAGTRTQEYWTRRAVIDNTNWRKASE